MAKNMRERILAAASNLFQARGINATGVDTIVAEAGIAKMTLYNHFKTKEDLVLEVVTRRSREFAERISARLDKSVVDPTEKLYKLFDYVGEWLADPQCSGLPFLKASAEFPQPDNPVHQLSAELSQEFRDYITGLAREAGIREPEALGLQLTMLIEGAVLSEQLSKGSNALEHARQAARILIESAKR
ncbi:TetR family transcriptional regulator [Novimethylophilus kurashikiensis]|uniref:TetR family transcriptional regulator n=2 Tax=Novimethylophilus kurashikiensis TaxID=1825523 RepID=A0A2R5FBJ1_9PROT|nr:TetR family transcriptional regulator [Novimethylophilus kurashikiensis]